MRQPAIGKGRLWLAACFWTSAFLVSCVLIVGAFATAPRVYLVETRALLFSRFEPESSTTERGLNDALSAHRVAANSRLNRNFINPELFVELAAFAKQHEDDGTALAREIARRMSSGRTLGGCADSESLAGKVAGVAQRFGCCSDYTAVFQVYAAALELPVRRVENETHTTSEYFDRRSGNWIWIDPMYRAQMTDVTGHLLSHYQIRKHLLEYQPVRIVEFLDAPMTAQTFHGLYDRTHYSIGYWYPLVDPAFSDEFDAELRWLLVPRAIRQGVALLLGIRERPIAVASSSIVHQLKVQARLGWTALALLAILEVLVASVATAHCIRLAHALLSRKTAEQRSVQAAESQVSE